MKKWAALGLAWWIVSANQVPQPESNFQYLVEEESHFFNYAEDFRSFAKSHINEGSEFEIPDHLSAIADLDSERLNTALNLAGIYKNAACEKDRLLVKSALKLQLEHLIKTFELDIEKVNSQLPFTKSPAVSQTAIRMKDELRDLRTKLDSMRAYLE